MPDPAVVTDPVTDPIAPPAPAAEPTPTKFAGKYDTPEALETGYRELRVGRLGLDPFKDDAVLVGKGGMYADHKALERAYSDLERIAGKMPAAKPGLSIETATPAAADPESGIEAVLDSIGLTGEEVGVEWQKSGKLTDDQYKKFAGKGLGKKAVDAFMAGQAALGALAEQKATASIREAETIAGGVEKLAVLRQWAGANIPAERLARLNKQVEADPSFYPEMIRLIASEHRAAVGAGGSTTTINGGPGGTAPSISSADDLIALNRKAASGDKLAQAQIARLTPAQLDALVGG